MTNAEARFNKSLRPRKPEGSLGRTAQDVHLDSHTAPELWYWLIAWLRLIPISFCWFEFHFLFVVAVLSVLACDFAAHSQPIGQEYIPQYRPLTVERLCRWDDWLTDRIRSSWLAGSLVEWLDDPIIDWSCREMFSPCYISGDFPVTLSATMTVWLSRTGHLLRIQISSSVYLSLQTLRSLLGHSL